MKILHVVKMKASELSEDITDADPNETIYVPANSAGVVDWASLSKVYKADDLVGRDRVRIVDLFEPMQLKTPIFKADEKL